MIIDFENILNVTEEILEQIRKWRNQKNISQFMYTNHYITKAEHRQWIKKLKEKTTMKTWIIRFDGKPVGVVSLSNIDVTNKTTEWGFYIASDSFRGKGIGSAALYRLMEYVFDELHFHMMSTMVLGNNLFAIQMYEKFGFKKDLNDVFQIKRFGEKIQVFRMWISKNDWPPIKRKFKNINTISVKRLDG